MQVLNFRHTRPTSNTLLQPKNYLYGCYKAVKWCNTILTPFYVVSVPYLPHEVRFEASIVDILWLSLNSIYRIVTK